MPSDYKSDGAIVQRLMFRSTFGRLQSKNVFAAKIQQTKRSNLTFRSFRFFSFDSFFSPLIVHLARLDLQSDRNEYKHF